MSIGTVVLKRPRLRGQAELEKRFESRLLPLFVKRTQEVQNLIPELYLHGLAEGDFDLALRGLPGDDAPLSPGTVARMKEKWNGEWDEWKQRPLRDDVVYLWVDGVYVKAVLEKSKAALLVALGATSDGRKANSEPGAKSESFKTPHASSAMIGIGWLRSMASQRATTFLQSFRTLANSE